MLRNLKQKIFLVSKFSILFLCVIKVVHSSEYMCPQLPITARIGDSLKDGWYVSRDNGEKVGFIDRKYQQYFGEDYKFKEWFSLKWQSFTDNTSLIQCCGAFDDLLLCLSRKVKSKRCVSARKLPYKEEDNKFICED